MVAESPQGVLFSQLTDLNCSTIEINNIALFNNKKYIKKKPKISWFMKKGKAKDDTRFGPLGRKNTDYKTQLQENKNVKNFNCHSNIYDQLLSKCWGCPIFMKIFGKKKFVFLFSFCFVFLFWVWISKTFCLIDWWRG